MSTAAIYNMVVEQGTDFVRTIVPLGGDNQPFDLTGFTSKLQARRNKSSSIALLTLSEGSGLTTDPSGSITIDLTEAQTSALSFSSAFYDLKLEKPGIPWGGRIIQGRIQVSRSVTR
jgi:hypothetical protein